MCRTASATSDARPCALSSSFLATVSRPLRVIPHHVHDWQQNCEAECARICAMENPSGQKRNKKDALGVEKAELSEKELEQISGGYFRITNIRAMQTELPEGLPQLPCCPRRLTPRISAGLPIYQAFVNPSPGPFGKISFPFSTRTPWKGSLEISRWPSRSA